MDDDDPRLCRLDLGGTSHALKEEDRDADMDTLLAAAALKPECFGSEMSKAVHPESREIQS
jgi:hypothetical protein